MSPDQNLRQKILKAKMTDILPLFNITGVDNIESVLAEFPDYGPEKKSAINKVIYNSLSEKQIDYSEVSTKIIEYASDVFMDFKQNMTYATIDELVSDEHDIYCTRESELKQAVTILEMVMTKTPNGLGKKMQDLHDTMKGFQKAYFDLMNMVKEVYVMTLDPESIQEYASMGARIDGYLVRSNEIINKGFRLADSEERRGYSLGYHASLFIHKARAELTLCALEKNLADESNQAEKMLYKLRESYNFYKGVTSTDINHWFIVGSLPDMFEERIKKASENIYVKFPNLPDICMPNTTDANKPY